MAKRRNFTDQFKAKVALEALRGDKTVQEIASKHQLHPNQVSTWKRQAIVGMADVFSGGGKQAGPSEAEVKDLHPQHPVYPYLLRKMLIDRPNQVPLSSPQAATAGQRVRGHHLHAGQEWLSLSGRDYGPGDTQGAELTSVTYDACRLLCRSA